MSLIGCNTANSLCLYKQDNATESLITIEAKVSGPDGWAAFGIGKQMTGSPIYVFWKNSAGECVVSRRDASGKTLPEFSNNQVQEITTLDPTVKSKVSDASLKCTMARKTGVRPPIEKELIWAVGAGVVNVENAKSRFAKHTQQGQLTVSTNQAVSLTAFSMIGVLVQAILIL